MAHMLNRIPGEIRWNPKYYPYFKDCIGAIDGTHVSASVPTSKQIPYRGRKTECTQNVMAACSFDMIFTFVNAGWEGTANDSRLLLHCIRNRHINFPKPPPGKYYVVDAGYPNMDGYLAPYKETRYHLPDYRRGGRPNGKEEEFNYAHSSLRNVIERCFGVLKARFPILKLMPSYDVTKQMFIVVASMTCHNFIRLHAVRDELFEIYGDEDLELEQEQINEDSDDFEEEIDVSDMNQMYWRREYIAETILRSNH